ncbi:hypothetical protein NQ314_015973 [Rhamnusium bicolor]|uniref:Uncharacterized protein n=1 Tax=Rhamnusium bicolor TaxID=1586634 RepID=A0AAV8WXF0_9CUCU|nr:hypothetical protein NQ314_015973 [Rhamnusium bicolor]
MSATEIVSLGIELVSLALAEECRKILERKKKRRPRRWWVKPWIQRREQLGASTQLLVEFAAEDPDSYRNHLRMSEAQFDFLLQKVSPSIQKADTFLRIALSAKLKLQVTLHYLATRTCFLTLNALYRVPACSISLMIPEVCKAIYEVLDEFIKVSKF